MAISKAKAATVVAIINRKLNDLGSYTKVTMKQHPVVLLRKRPAAIPNVMLLGNVPCPEDIGNQPFGIVYHTNRVIDLMPLQMIPKWLRNSDGTDITSDAFSKMFYYDPHNAVPLFKPFACTWWDTQTPYWVQFVPLFDDSQMNNAISVSAAPNAQRSWLRSDYKFYCVICKDVYGMPDITRPTYITLEDFIYVFNIRSVVKSIVYMTQVPDLYWKAITDARNQTELVQALQIEHQAGMTNVDSPASYGAPTMESLEVLAGSANYNKTKTGDTYGAKFANMTLDSVASLLMNIIDSTKPPKTMNWNLFSYALARLLFAAPADVGASTKWGYLPKVIDGKYYDRLISLEPCGVGRYIGFDNPSDNLPHWVFDMREDVPKLSLISDNKYIWSKSLSSWSEVQAIAKQATLVLQCKTPFGLNVLGGSSGIDSIHLDEIYRLADSNIGKTMLSALKMTGCFDVNPYYYTAPYTGLRIQRVCVTETVMSAMESYHVFPDFWDKTKMTKIASERREKCKFLLKHILEPQCGAIIESSYIARYLGTTDEVSCSVEYKDIGKFGLEVCLKYALPNGKSLTACIQMPNIYCNNYRVSANGQVFNLDSEDAAGFYKINPYTSAYSNFQIGYSSIVNKDELEYLSMNFDPNWLSSIGVQWHYTMFLEPDVSFILMPGFRVPAYFAYQLEHGCYMKDYTETSGVKIPCDSESSK